MTVKRNTPKSLSDLLSDKKTDSVEDSSVVEEKVDNVPTDSGKSVDDGELVTSSADVPGSDPVLVDDETFAEPANVPEVVKSSGPDNSDSTEFVTTAVGTIVDKTKYDNSGNGKTDNYPNDWDPTLPSGAVSSQTPSENASTRYTVVQTDYAKPAEVDDKGLGKDDPDVLVSEAARGARESVLQNYPDAVHQNIEDENNPDYRL